MLTQVVTEPASTPEPTNAGRTPRPIERLWRLWRAGEKPAVIALCAAILLLLAAATPLRLRQLLTACTARVCAQQQLMPTEVAALRHLGLSMTFYAIFLTTLEVVFPIGCACVAALIVSRGRERITLYVALMLVSWGAAMPPTMEALAAASPTWRLPVLIVQNLASFLLIGFFFVFPNGHFVPRPAIAVVALWGLWNLARLAFVQSTPFRPATAEGLVILALLALGVAAQVYRYHYRANARQRQQTKWAVYGLAITTTGIIAFVLPHSVVTAFLEPGAPRALSFLLMIPPFMTLGGLCLPLSIGVAVMRNGLFDIDTLINRTLVYGVVTLMLTGLYAVLALALQTAVRDVSGQGSALAVGVSTLVIAGLFQPLRRRMQVVIDQRFYRRHYSAAQTIMAFTATLPNAGDLPSLSARLTEVVQGTVEPSSISLWLRPALGGAETDKAAPVRDAAARGSTTPRGERARTCPAPFTQISDGDPIVAPLLAAPASTPVAGLPEASLTARALRGAGVQLVTPLVSQGELVGMLILGGRLSGEEYSVGDLSLLNTLAAQVAPAVRVAQMAREHERIEQELRVARLIQTTLLPKSVPDYPGWSLAAYYQPARAVGGDFYDFLHLADDQLGVVIGDVTDKGVPAALVMASTRSLLRAAARDSVSPGETLRRANDLLYPDMPPSMFVTCFYATLDVKTGRLRYANAGHDLPYLRRDGAARELYATGSPLGLMPDRDYDEGEMELAPGDSLLLYTDGLVEAHNPQREMFGFPQLATLLSQTPAGAPLIAPLLAALEAFTGPAWEQEDDVTLVTLQWRRDEVN